MVKPLSSEQVSGLSPHLRAMYVDSLSIAGLEEVRIDELAGSEMLTWVFRDGRFMRVGIEAEEDSFPFLMAQGVLDQYLQGLGSIDPGFKIIG